jgi:hypothetical protein
LTDRSAAGRFFHCATESAKKRKRKSHGRPIHAKRGWVARATRYSAVRDPLATVFSFANRRRKVRRTARLARKSRLRAILDIVDRWRNAMSMKKTASVAAIPGSGSSLEGRPDGWFNQSPCAANLVCGHTASVVLSQLKSTACHSQASIVGRRDDLSRRKVLQMNRRILRF